MQFKVVRHPRTYLHPGEDDVSRNEEGLRFLLKGTVHSGWELNIFYSAPAYFDDDVRMLFGGHAPEFERFLGIRNTRFDCNLATRKI